MIHKIVTAGQACSYPDNPLALTGPMALHDCYVQHSDDVWRLFMYHDTRDTAYPFNGMHAVNNKLLAFESPNNQQHNAYTIINLIFELHEVYRSTCPLHQEEKKKKILSKSGMRKIKNQVPWEEKETRSKKKTSYYFILFHRYLSNYIHF